MLFYGNQVLTTFDGKPMDNNGKGPLTLAHLAWNSLIGAIVDRSTKGNVKVKRYQLAKRIYEADGPIELDPADVLHIESCIDSVWASPMIAGQAITLLHTTPVDNVVPLQAAE